MKKDDLIMALLILAVLFIVFNFGGDVFFQWGNIRFFGDAGLFLILLIVIMVLWRRRQQSQMARA
jgi:phosphoglycerol transferase MdoB-like AlkP superfamily enzyme